jgi:hypothetical protein
MRNKTLDGVYVAASPLNCGSGDDYVIWNNAYAYIGVVMATSLLAAQQSFNNGTLIQSPAAGSGCWAKTLPF